MPIRLAAVIAAIFCAAPASAQAPGVRIESNDHPEFSREVLDRAAALVLSGAAPLEVRQVRRLLVQPRPAAFDLPPASAEPLPPAEIARRARAAQVRIGWYYHCGSCDVWHLSLSGGYAVARGGVVATCQHSIDPHGFEEMDEGYLVAVDEADRVRPVTSILAADAAADVVLVKVEGVDLTPLPLSTDVSPGDAAHVLSDPLGHSGHFSTGSVNRFYWRAPDQPSPAAPRGGRPWPEGRRDLHTVEGVRRLVMSVSSEWAPGSSGCAVLDACGNAIGQVSTINPVRESEPGDESDRFDGAVLITLHDATPARVVRLLAESCREAAQRRATVTSRP